MAVGLRPRAAPAGRSNALTRDGAPRTGHSGGKIVRWREATCKGDVRASPRALNKEVIDLGVGLQKEEPVVNAVIGPARRRGPREVIR